MGVLFLTGYPGFLGAELLPRLLAHSADPRAVCLVQRRYMRLARARLQVLELAEPGVRGRVRLVEGDLVLPDLGLGGEARTLGERITEIWHLAAVYDLAVDAPLAYRVNVEGTRHVLGLARACPRLERLQYMSTCYVSGRHPGIFREQDLDRGQSFNNAYEKTKYLAEVEVRQAMGEGLPATVYRPSVVVGDSRTGATQKYDGPYFVIRLLLRQPGLALLPVPGNPEASRLNVVPRDFVIDALEHLGRLPHAVGRTYHLADPEPPTVAAAIGAITDAVGKKVLRLSLPAGLVKRALAGVPGLQRIVGMPPEAIDYFDHPTHYEVTHARQELDAAGIRVPAFVDYAGRLVAFARAHPEIGARPMA